eukprot:GEMP01038280.1.p1 GENE.GEMP01038280.1~~GEMP01038280.1.p1  ORF type:complete len:283 (+),score=12.52 GEMP01038280.1:288-1136(+)
MTLRGRWAEIGRPSLESILKKRFGSIRPRIREDDDIDEVVQTILDKNTGDFTWSLCFEPHFLRRLFSYGFITIAVEISGSLSEPLYVLLPKLHRERCVLNVQDVRVSRGARKKSNRYALTVNQAYDQVVAGCLEQHGESWLYPPVVEAFRTLRGSVIHSVELWEGARLVAGELGYAFGQVYTSLTGFYLDSGTGSIQLGALGGLLLQCGYALWDLGMELDYKASLGAVTLPRRDFLTKFNGLTKLQPMNLINDSERQSARTLIDSLRGRPTSQISDKSPRGL